MKNKAKALGGGVFETRETIDTFGQKATLADGTEAQELSTQATTPLVDDASGQKLILRAFEFQLPLDIKGRIDKQKVFDAHKKFIEQFCWKDGLVPVTDIPPRVILSKNEKKVRIFILTQAKLGSTILEKPLTLQEITKPHATTGHTQ